MSALNLDSIDLQLLRQLQSSSTLSNQELAHQVHVSAPTCLRRVKRLKELGLIEREIAILNVDALAGLIGHFVTVLVEVSLDRQDQAALAAFEQRAVAFDAVQQCYRVSPGPDFCLVVHAASMAAYLALTEQLFTADANVRNVKSFFSIKRSKFGAAVPLPDPKPTALAD